jgi:hypothetical protein
MVLRYPFFGGFVAGMPGFFGGIGGCFGLFSLSLPSFGGPGFTRPGLLLPFAMSLLLYGSSMSISFFNVFVSYGRKDPCILSDLPSRVVSCSSIEFAMSGSRCINSSLMMLRIS